MGTKKATGSKSTSKYNKSPAKKTSTTTTQENQQPVRALNSPPISTHAPTEPAPAQSTPEPFKFRGHPQPPVDERLFAARNFLADEDPDRCLRFDTKIAQIEELVAQIENDKAPCDPEFFRDVKVKLKVHRDWEARRKTSPFDTGCCEAPLIAPFSTRLISADTAAALRQEREAQGLVTQMRTDHAPFSVNAKDDHAAFLAKMREEAMTDPIEVDRDSNLLWTESRAYLWAMRNPSLIPYWMHPKNGIPMKRTAAADSRSRLHVSAAGAENRKPSRDWVPAHVATTEAKINELLEIQAPSSEEFALLQELLCPFESMDLHELHKQDESFTEAAVLGRLSPHQKSTQEDIKTRYNSAWRSWVNSLILNGVCLIIRTRGEPETLDQPGVFYVEDGIPSPEHMNTLEKAQSLLDRLLANGRMDLTEQESASLDRLMQNSLPNDIAQVQREILRILEVHGANSVSDLDRESHAKVIELEKTELERRLEWEDALKRSGGAEFCYLRPAEIKQSEHNILYLPWDLTAIPQASVQARPDLQLPPQVQMLQDDLNKDLPRNINLPNIDTGSLHFRKLLEQLVYPDLRDLLTPYFALRQKEATGPLLTSDEERQYTILAAAVHPLWEAWCHGLGTKITIKMPRAEQQNNSPGVMYCRNPSDKTIGEDLETYFTRKAAAINHVFSRYASQALRTDLPEYYSDLYSLCKDLQYPALKKLEEKYLVANDAEECNRLRGDWEVTFKRWMQSKKGHTVRVKLPNPRIDPDDDPSVVYYRGPLFTPSDFPAMPEDIKNSIQTIRALAFNNFPADLRSQLPPLLQRLIEAYEEKNSPEAKVVLEWHLAAFMNASTSSQPASPTMTRSNPTSPTVFSTLMYSPNQMRPLSPPWSQEHFAQVDVDLTDFLPEIRAVESEINRLLALFGEGSTSPYLGSPNGITTAFRQLDDHLRLTKLLEQFWPHHIYQRWYRAEKYKSMLRIMGRNGHKISAKEYEDTLTAWEDDFLKAHSTWLTELRASGVHIQTSPEETRPLDKVTLAFQRATTMRATETHPEPTFCVLAPEVITGPEVCTSRLVYKGVYDTPPSSTSVNYSAMLRAQLIIMENEINVLLEKRRSSEWTWDESEVLLGHMRAFMFPSLFELDSKFRAIDKKARLQTLTGGELNDWYRMMEDWHQAYNSWLNGFPPEGIVIDKGDQMGRHSGVLKLKIEDPMVLRPITRPKILPHHIKSREDLIKKWVSNPSLMSETNRLELSQILAPLLRPILQEFRRLVQDHIQLRICKRSGKHPEDDTLLEAIIFSAQSLLLWAILQSRNKCTIQVLEPIPGEFTIQCVDSSGTVIFPEPEAEENVFAQQLFDQLCPPFLEGTKIMFHDLAFRIRTDAVQSKEDFDFLTHNIPTISKADSRELSSRVTSLLISLEEHGVVKSQIQKELSDTITKLLWKMFVSLHLDQVENIWKIIDNPMKPRQRPLIVARRLPGALPLGPPPLVAPNGLEIKALEIELNNLLIRERTSMISKEQQQKLSYILRALLPPRLRFLKNRIDKLDRQYMAQEGLDLRDTLELVDIQDQFEPQFEDWKKSISDLGIVLDRWLCTPKAIAEACSRARQWKEITTTSDGSTNPGNISNQIEDINVKECHDVYTVLKDFVHTGCQDSSFYEDQLQLNAVPQEIRDQISQIAAQTKAVSASTASDDKSSKAMLLQTMQDQLIKLYVKWLVRSLTPTQRQRLFIQVKGSQDKIDFAPKAERRGVQRAAIELALNLLATNQEQHRTKDHFRMVTLPSNIKSPEKKVPLCLPLKPDERPLEQDPLEYTKKMLAFRRWKDYDYGISRLRLDQSGSLPAPENFKGPSSIATVEDVQAAARLRLKELASVQKGLIEAVKTAPRPLLQQLLLLVDTGLNYDKEAHALLDGEKLTADAIDILEELAGQSWDEERQEYGDRIPGIDKTPDDHSRLEQFELDMAEMTEIPPWEPAPYPDAMDEDSFEHLAQVEYDPTIPSTRGMTGEELRQAIGDRRLAKSDGKAGTLHLWDLRALLKYLRAMESARRIHLDELSNGDVLVSRIPLGGHPENKYVISRAPASSSPGVRYDEEGKLEVKYDVSSRVGPPILQPNKFHYLQKLAFRLGRDLKKNALVLAGEDPNPKDRVEGQLDARAAAEVEMDNILPADRSGEPIGSSDPPPRNITLQRMAQDLHKIAPDLAVEAGLQIKSGVDISKRQAATLLQMQILEEASNNWEFKFPEKENVWNFASDRVEISSRMIRGRSVEGRPRTTQYFHMREFPPCCQSEATKTIIKKSGPAVQEKPVPIVHPATDTDQKARTEQKVRHIRGREPYFSLGESAYERAFLSWRMEQELKDVPEFQIPKKRRSWWQFGKEENDDENQVRRERYPLPKIPDHWVPDSVSIAEKRAHVLELAKKTPAFPNPDILEYYHTPREIEQIKLERQWEEFYIKRRVATAAVEKFTGKRFDSLTNEEWQKACDELEINSVKCVFIDDEKVDKRGKREGMKKRKQGRGNKNMALREDVNEDGKRTRVV